jgi:hypothetical protein
VPRLERTVGGAVRVEPSRDQALKLPPLEHDVLTNVVRDEVLVSLEATKPQWEQAVLALRSEILQRSEWCADHFRASDGRPVREYA